VQSHATRSGRMRLSVEGQAKGQARTTTVSCDDVPRGGVILRS